MSLDALLDTIERRGRQEVERVLEEARGEADAITRAAEARLREHREGALREIEARLRAEAGAELAAARRGARARVLRSRERLLDRVFEAAGLTLPSAALGEAFRETIPGLLAEALRCVDPAGATVECAPPLQGAVTEVLDAGLGDELSGPVGVRPAPEAETGIRVLSADSRVLVDGTLAARLERGRPRLAIIALDALGRGPQMAGGAPNPVGDR